MVQFCLKSFALKLSVSVLITVHELWMAHLGRREMNCNLKKLAFQPFLSQFIVVDSVDSFHLAWLSKGTFSHNFTNVLNKKCDTFLWYSLLNILYKVVLTFASLD